MMSWPLSIGQAAALACMLEATAPKPGNVYRGADFDDLSYPELIASGIAIAPVIDSAAAYARSPGIVDARSRDRRPTGEQGRAGGRNSSLGRFVLEAVLATRQVAGSNSNLGMVLLLVPLAMASAARPWSQSVSATLAGLTADDAVDVYEAIRQAKPGGLGSAAEGDVAGPPPDDLLQAMRWGEDRDRIAWQYTHGFADVLEVAAPALSEFVECGYSLCDAIVRTYLKLLAAQPDTLIARKCGCETARTASALAADVLAAGEPGDDDYEQQLADFDFWLRSDGRRRNPGTTADLVCAGLFVNLCDDRFPRPWRLYGDV